MQPKTVQNQDVYECVSCSIKVEKYRLMFFLYTNPLSHNSTPSAILRQSEDAGLGRTGVWRNAVTSLMLQCYFDRLNVPSLMLRHDAPLTRLFLFPFLWDNYLMETVSRPTFVIGVRSCTHISTHSKGRTTKSHWYWMNHRLIKTHRLFLRKY